MELRLRNRFEIESSSFGIDIVRAPRERLASVRGLPAYEFSILRRLTTNASKSRTRGSRLIAQSHNETFENLGSGPRPAAQSLKCSLPWEAGHGVAVKGTLHDRHTVAGLAKMLDGDSIGPRRGQAVNRQPHRRNHRELHDAFGRRCVRALLRAA